MRDDADGLRVKWDLPVAVSIVIVVGLCLVWQWATGELPLSTDTIGVLLAGAVGAGARHRVEGQRNAQIGDLLEKALHQPPPGEVETPS